MSHTSEETLDILYYIYDLHITILSRYKNYRQIRVSSRNQENFLFNQGRFNDYAVIWGI